MRRTLIGLLMLASVLGISDATAAAAPAPAPTTQATPGNPYWGDYGVLTNVGSYTVWVYGRYELQDMPPAQDSLHLSPIIWDANRFHIHTGRCAAVRMMDQWGNYGPWVYEQGPKVRPLGNTAYQVKVAPGNVYCP